MDKKIIFSRSQELGIYLPEEDISKVFIYGKDIGDDHEFGVFFTKSELTAFVKDLQQIITEMQ